MHEDSLLRCWGVRACVWAVLCCAAHRCVLAGVRQAVMPAPWATV